VAFWFFFVAWVVVLGLLFFVQVPRGFREARRIVRRLMRLINDPPLTKELAKAEADGRRLSIALERIPSLQRRAERAIETIRTTPLVPPTIGETIRRIRAEIQAFRQALR
jgi:hypothetical protein